MRDPVAWHHVRVLEPLLIQKTLRVPLAPGEPGDGSVVARQLEAALLSVGFTCSADLLRHLSALRPAAAMTAGVQLLGAVRARVGDHVQHNPYFRDFPAGVPDTLEFWLDCWNRATGDVAVQVYGTVQHTYAEMLERHDELIASARDRLTVLRLGGTLDEEVHAVYHSLAASPIPLTESDLELLALVAAWCADSPPPASIPVRENRALLNRVRIAHGRPPLVDTVTDVLRLACAMSGGDPTLLEPTRFSTFARRDRRALLAALHDVVEASPAKLGDVNAHRERWKRLGERLHPHEHARYPGAQAVFAVARGERVVRSFASRVEAAYAGGDVLAVANLLSSAPGVLLRGLDRLLSAAGPGEVGAVLDTVRAVVPRVSGRVLLSVREHFGNRRSAGGQRIFVNRTGRGVAVPDVRPLLDDDVIGTLLSIVDEEVRGRLPEVGRLTVDDEVLDIAVPTSDKGRHDGAGVLPRGSESAVDGTLVRFFTYWKQTGEDTDYDLSVLLLDDEFQYAGHVSYTNLSGGGATHSGDLTSAPDGATEFVDLALADITARYVVPQVNIYAGESFDAVEESFFGYMDRDLPRGGKPFEPATVRMKSELRGPGRIALPLAFVRADDGGWQVKWLHLHLSGAPQFNRVEDNNVTTADLVAAVVRRRYLTMAYLVDLLRPSENGPALHVDLHNFTTLLPE
jgi:hypothetical protein